jgi:hypothetical protein
MADLSSTVVVKTKMDNTEFNRQMDELKNKAKSLRETGPGGSMSQLSEQYRKEGQTVKADRMEEHRQRANKQNRLDLERHLKSEESLLQKNIDLYAKKHQILESSYIVEKRMTEETLKQADLQDRINASSAAISRTKEVLYGDSGGGVGRGGGISGAGIRKSPAAKFASIAATIGAIGSAANRVNQQKLYADTMGERQSQSKATIAKTLNEGSILQSQRRGYEMNYYGSERSEAIKTSENRMNAERAKDSREFKIESAKLYGGIVTTIAGMITANPIAVAGGAALAYSGASNIYGSDRLRTKYMKQHGKYDTMIGEAGAKAYEKDLQARKQQDPTKMLAAEFFEKNKERMLKTQRALGLSDKELFSGSESIYDRASNASFDGSEVDRQMMGMLSAGGTTTASKEGGIMAAKMSRDLNLTNAAELMGKVSGRTGGGGKESRDEIIRMYAEATKLGLNESEVRNLLQVSTQTAYQSGASGTEMQGLLQMGGPLKSSRDLTAATNALKYIKGKTGEVGDSVKMQFGMAEFGSEDFSKFISGIKGKDGTRGTTKNLNAGDLAKMTSFDTTETHAKNKTLENALAQMNIHYDNISKEQLDSIFAKIKQINLKSTMRNNVRMEAIKEIGSIQKEIKGTSDPEKRKKLNRKLTAAKGRQDTGIGTENPEFYNLASPEQSRIGQMERGIINKQTGLSATEADIKAVEDKKSSKIIDSYIAGEAASFKAQVGFLKDNLGTLTEAFAKAAKSSAWDALEQLAARLAAAGKLTDEGVKAIQAEKLKTLGLNEQSGSNDYSALQNILNSSNSSNYLYTPMTAVDDGEDD